MNTSEVLNRAADLIEERGWTTGSGWFGNEYGPLCIEGGIAAAMGVAGGPGYRCPAYDAVAAYLGKGNSGVWAWNDNLPHTGMGWRGGSREAAMEQSREQVIATLRAVALIEAAKENTTTAAPESVPA